MIEIISHKTRGTVFAVVVLSGVNIGISAKFWYFVVTPPPPLTVNWSPGIYWILGIVAAAVSIGLLRRNRAILSSRHWWVLLSVNSIVFTGYLAVAATLFSRSFVLLN